MLFGKDRKRCKIRLGWYWMVMNIRIMPVGEFLGQYRVEQLDLTIHGLYHNILFEDIHALHVLLYTYI